MFFLNTAGDTSAMASLITEVTTFFTTGIVSWFGALGELIMGEPLLLVGPVMMITGSIFAYWRRAISNT